MCSKLTVTGACRIGWENSCLRSRRYLFLSRVVHCVRCPLQIPQVSQRLDVAEPQPELVEDFLCPIEAIRGESEGGDPA